MAKVTLSQNVTLIGARRVLTRRKSSFALTLRNGQLYTYRKSSRAVQPNTAAQLHARSLLQQANVLAREDLLRPGRRDYWLSRARSTGYKTAIGCARAYFVALLKSRASISRSSPASVSSPSKQSSLAAIVSAPKSSRPHPLSPSPSLTISRRRSRLVLSFTVSYTRPSHFSQQSIKS